MTEDSRFRTLKNWLVEWARQQGRTVTAEPVPASSDASFRRYFRVELDGTSFILMDAPPAHENSEPFVRIAGWLAEMGLNMPRVLAWEQALGFLLLTDLGERDYQQCLTAETADALYGAALDALIRMQVKGAAYVDRLPRFDAEMLRAEMRLFSDWLVQRHLSLPVPPFWTDVETALIEAALAQPTVFVHRDYHSRNLMVSEPNPGILDFQDAVAGPLTYDVVSLLRDCYVRWPIERVAGWRDGYFDRLVQAGLQQQSDRLAFMQAFDLMGIQRHLKAAGIFVRLYHRDGKPRYLGDVLNTLQYIAEIGAAYAETVLLAQWVEKVIIPAWRATPLPEGVAA